MTRIIALISLALAALEPLPAQARTLKVCADPEQLPYSDRAGNGFENQIARLLARELGSSLVYTWWPQRRDFLRSTLRAGACDVVIGVPVGLPGVRTTRPYYRSSFAVVSRPERALRDLDSIDDPRLLELAVGVPLAGDDGANPAPVHALAARGARHLVGYPLAGAAAAMLEALRSGAIDVALLWAPSLPATTGLRVRLLREEADAGLPFAFAIALGVRATDEPLARQLDEVLVRKRAAISAILDHAHVVRREARP